MKNTSRTDNLVCNSIEGARAVSDIGSSVVTGAAIGGGTGAVMGGSGGAYMGAAVGGLTGGFSAVSRRGSAPELAARAQRHNDCMDFMSERRPAFTPQYNNVPRGQFDPMQSSTTYTETPECNIM